MEVLGHDHISCDHKLIFVPGLLQKFQEKVTARRRAQKRQPVITRRGNEMPVTLPVDANQTFRHRLILHSHPLRLTESRGKSAREIQSQRMGHPISVEGG